MNWLKRGPQLKLPDVWVPKFLEDLYFDLKDRRLLPVVALALVALVAVPILLSGGAKETPEATVQPVAGGAPAAKAKTASLTVVPANPGLREYRRRLRGRKPTDPFKQRFTAPELKGAKLGSKGNNGFESSPEAIKSTSSSTMITTTDESETVKTTRSEDGVVKTSTKTQKPSGSSSGEQAEPAPTKTTTTVPTTPKGGEGESSGGAEPPSPETSVPTYAIDVKIEKIVPASTGGTEKTAPVVKKVVASPTPLPGEKDQVLTYVGIDGKTKNPMFLVSDEVTSVYGEAECLAGKSECRLLGVEVGMPMTMVVGQSQVRYKFTVMRAEAVITVPAPPQS